MKVHLPSLSTSRSSGTQDGASSRFLFEWQLCSKSGPNVGLSPNFKNGISSMLVTDICRNKPSGNQIPFHLRHERLVGNEAHSLLIAFTPIYSHKRCEKFSVPQLWKSGLSGYNEGCTIAPGAGSLRVCRQQRSLRPWTRVLSFKWLTRS